MKVWYYVSTHSNLLYGGAFFSHGRYKSYGQHSFIYDFVISAFRNSVEVDLIIEGLQAFPILKIVEPYCNVVCPEEVESSLSRPDIVVIDVVDERMIERIPRFCPVLCMVHNAGEIYTEQLINICDRFICMTETAYAFQSKRIAPEKLWLINQGIDLSRFSADRMQPAAEEKHRKVLYYTRLNTEKREVIFNVLKDLERSDCDFTVLGDGALFWEISDLFGNNGIIINYIPCHCIPQFISDFDVIISSGRGVMESCAVGKPTICAGLGYAGVVNAGNTEELLKRNLTGYGFSKDALHLTDDLETAMSLETNSWRTLAEQYFNMDTFVNTFVKEAEKLVLTSGSYNKLRL